MEIASSNRSGGLYNRTLERTDIFFVILEGHTASCVVVDIIAVLQILYNAAANANQLELTCPYPTR